MPCHFCFLLIVSNFATGVGMLGECVLERSNDEFVIHYHCACSPRICAVLPISRWCMIPGKRDTWYADSAQLCECWRQAEKRNKRSYTKIHLHLPALHFLRWEIAKPPRHLRRTEYQPENESEQDRDEHAEGERCEANFLRPWCNGRAPGKKWKEDNI